jgi:TetR/AcrR family transcriptional repressor of lmrAB and yxaGH operons
MCRTVPDREATVALETAHTSDALAAATKAALASWQAVLRQAIADQGVGESEAASLAMLVVAGMEGALLLALTARDPAPLHTVAAELADVLRLRTTQDGAGRATR